MSEVTVSTSLFICVFHRTEKVPALLFNCLLPPGSQNWSCGPGRPRLACGSQPSQCLRPHMLAVWTWCLQVRGRTLGSPVCKPSLSWILQEPLVFLCHQASKSSCWVFICLSVACGLLGTRTMRDVCHMSADWVFNNCRAERVQSSPPCSLTPALELSVSLSSSPPWGAEAHQTDFCSVPLFHFLSQPSLSPSIVKLCWFLSVKQIHNSVSRAWDS